MANMTITAAIGVLKRIGIVAVCNRMYQATRQGARAIK